MPLEAQSLLVATHHNQNFAHLDKLSRKHLEKERMVEKEDDTCINGFERVPFLAFLLFSSRSACVLLSGGVKPKLQLYWMRLLICVGLSYLFIRLLNFFFDLKPYINTIPFRKYYRDSSNLWITLVPPFHTYFK